MEEFKMWKMMMKHDLRWREDERRRIAISPQRSVEPRSTLKES